MSIIDLTTAKLHLRVDADVTVEDALIQAQLDAAEAHAAHYLKRRLYATQEALNTARAGVGAILAAATTAYVTAVDAAEALPSDAERAFALTTADDTYQAAQAEARRVMQGAVMNPQIQAAVLLILGHLYANREDTTPQPIADLPMGAIHLLQPLRVYG